MNSKFTKTVIAVGAEDLQSLLEERATLIQSLTETQKHNTDLVLQNRSLNETINKLQAEIERLRNQTITMPSQQEAMYNKLAQDFKTVVHPSFSDIIHQDQLTRTSNEDSRNR